MSYVQTRRWAPVLGPIAIVSLCLANCGYGCNAAPSPPNEARSSLEQQQAERCKMTAKIQCPLHCNQIDFGAQCDATLGAGCDADCDTSATGTCLDHCSADCSVGCDAGTETDCNATCRSTCSDNCAKICVGAQRPTACADACKAQCDSRCGDTCTSDSSASCDGKCGASCDATCTVEAHVACELRCSVAAWTTCKANMAAKCMADCSTEVMLSCADDPKDVGDDEAPDPVTPKVSEEAPKSSSTSRDAPPERDAGTTPTRANGVVGIDGMPPRSDSE